MRLLYIADNGFSYHEGYYYYTRPNEVNSSQYLRYFDDVLYIARKSSYKGNEIRIKANSKVRLVGRYDIIALRKAMNNLEDDYDVVLVRSGFLGCFAARYAKQLGKILISFSGSDPYEFYMSKKTLKSYFIAHIWRKWESKKMMLADYAHYCTSVLYERYPCNCPFLVCSDVNVHKDEIALKNRIDKIVSRRDEVVVGLMGQFDSNENKGIPFAIRALGLLPSNYRIEIVGNGRPEKYKKLIDKIGLGQKVLFKGYYQDKRKIDSWLDSVDIYIQPSLSEGLPRATIEAMSRGCPVIGSDVCGMKDLLPNEWMVNPKDYRALASAIKRMAHVELMKKAAERNYKVACNYTSEIRDKKMDIFFGMIVNQCANG